MSNTQKDQLRSLKNVVNSKLSPSFKSVVMQRRQASLAGHSGIAPSTTQSECSTLVDFSIDWVAEEYVDEGDNNSFLSADNVAWSRRRGTIASRTQSPRITSEHGDAAEMLDTEDRAWSGSKQNKSLPTRILHALAGQ